ncbi:MAG: hypothetical protein JXR36_04230 [Bacteroidales bacterium]|nr:hypothetical protein [Bacteroidales bacterium]
MTREELLEDMKSVERYSMNSPNVLEILSHTYQAVDANKHDKLRVFTAFQHWLATNYANLPADSGNMTRRAIRYLKENPTALDLFAVSGSLPSDELIRERGEGFEAKTYYNLGKGEYIGDFEIGAKWAVDYFLGNDR